MKKYKYVAWCQEPEYFNNNLVFDLEYTQRFPGSGWLPYFSDMLQDAGYEIATGDIALEKVRNDKWAVEEILVIQHDLSPSYADKLIAMGATPYILTCYEPPLFAAEFCRALPSIAGQFPHRVIYQGLHELLDGVSGNNYQIRFPSLSIDEIIEPKEWNSRKFITMVSGNKFVAELTFKDKLVLLKNRGSKIFNPSNWIKYMKFILQKISGHVKHINREKTAFDLQCESNGYSEIQTKRLEAIEFFGKNKLLDLFGRGWDNLDWLGANWKDKLSPIMKEAALGPCNDKFETMASYKFYLCFENIFYKGAFTEKIVDCFRCGVIPVYYGVPDIADYFPKEAFFDVQDYDDWEMLLKDLNNIDSSKAEKMIQAGQAFLHSKDAERHTYKGHAEFYTDLITRYEEYL